MNTPARLTAVHWKHGEGRDLARCGQIVGSKGVLAENPELPDMIEILSAVPAEQRTGHAQDWKQHVRIVEIPWTRVPNSRAVPFQRRRRTNSRPATV